MLCLIEINSFAGMFLCALGLIDSNVSNSSDNDNYNNNNDDNKNSNNNDNDNTMMITK